MNDMALSVAFADQSQSFVHGFEAGMIWQEMQTLPDVIDRGVDEGFPVHTANMETLRRMAADRGYAIETKVGDMEEYTAVRFERASHARPKLSVIQGGAP